MKHAVAAVAAYLLYLVFAGSLGGEALISALAISIMAVGSAAFIRRVAERPIVFSAADGLAWLRAVAKLPGDTLRIGATLLRVSATGGLTGRGVETPFHYGEINDAHQRGRRATAVLAGSLTPDTIVLHVAPGRDAICHRLLSAPAPSRPESLV